MKYSVRGSMNLTDGTEVNLMLNKYILWRLVTTQTADTFSFEAWVNTVEDKDSLFNELKPFVDVNGEVVDWHECSHDEPISTPCVIAEEYRGVI